MESTSTKQREVSFSDTRVGVAGKKQEEAVAGHPHSPQCAPEAIMGLEVAGRSEGSLTCSLTKRLVSSQADIARVTTSCL